MAETLLRWIFLASIPFALTSSLALLIILMPAMPFLRVGFEAYARWLPNTPLSNRIALWFVLSMSAMLYSGFGLRVIRVGLEKETVLLLFVAIGLTACVRYFLPGGGRPLTAGKGGPKMETTPLSPKQRLGNLLAMLVFFGAVLAYALYRWA
jgi:hypothetical protein